MSMFRKSAKSGRRCLAYRQGGATRRHDPVSAELTKVQDNTEIWGEHYDGKLPTSSPFSSKSPATSPAQLRSKLTGSEKQQVARQGTQNPEAYQLYVKGRYYWNKRTNADIKTAISYFNQAIDKDPGYALAYAGVADAYTVCAITAAIPTMSFPSRMRRPKRPWSSIPLWRVLMRISATTTCITTGIFPAARPSSERHLS